MKISEHTQELTKKMCNNDICNNCAKKKKSKQQENPVVLKKTKQKIIKIASNDLGLTTSTSSDIVISNNFNIIIDNFSNTLFDNSVTIASDVSNIITDNFGNIISSSSIYNKSKQNIQSDNNSEMMMYDLDEVHEIIAKEFEETKIFNDSVNFAFEVELTSTTDLKIIKIRFGNLASLLTIPLESRSATAYLGCTMWDNQAWKRPDNQLLKRQNEAQAPIERYEYNSLALAMQYLEQPEFKKRGFKVLTYLENNFVQTLRFLTPLLKHVGTENATKIVIDSTFKTNQECFELFAVNLNYDKYDMPIAYLYLSMLNSSEKV
ncbi:19428_t:CDS:2 [Cetraspora pellucida]|uniref:19428_t:CDS:1 n=1 Tax=Cetraspora pellucida TaxID=1433469 RepID=A0A9N9AYA6_9GLOM|nr:19428_t:CDS:2 [Cetraspora pellucida]